jgi:hypothetical protein
MKSVLGIAIAVMGLVIDRPAGNQRIYQLHAQVIGALQAYVDDVWGEAISRFRLLADNAQPRQGR